MKKILALLSCAIVCFSYQQEGMVVEKNNAETTEAGKGVFEKILKSQKNDYSKSYAMWGKEEFPPRKRIIDINVSSDYETYSLVFKDDESDAYISDSLIFPGKQRWLIFDLNITSTSKEKVSLILNSDEAPKIGDSSLPLFGRIKIPSSQKYHSLTLLTAIFPKGNHTLTIFPYSNGKYYLFFRRVTPFVGKNKDGLFFSIPDTPCNDLTECRELFYKSEIIEKDHNFNYGAPNPGYYFFDSNKHLKQRYMIKE